ncbi:hypothetical protein HanHA300_Chr03g0081171 [Helianthus annuus]|nr:hypothetical protein HanHA300_Chr03g0081171 [Helianthus annuus]KAJ0607102.1 hypothetical protein HanHA89_Chr03g0092631 [Helianthus annuus]KAJ0767155.1 hypothetical protein HanLR1_Chr03g0085851 [Helianthus annuus]
MIFIYQLQKQNEQLYFKPFLDGYFLFLKHGDTHVDAVSRVWN